MGSQYGLLKALILVSIAGAAICMRLYSVIRFESIIHEFDPWFNFRATKYLSEHGFNKFLDWFDDRTWYPLGRVTGGTLYPGLMVSSNVIHKLLTFVGIPLDIRNVSVLFAPAFSGLTAFFTYLMAKEMKDEVTGLLSALFMGMAPGYISRSVAGSYDNEAISITLLMATFYFWIKAVKQGSVLYSVATAISYFYMVSAWGGYVFITNLIPLHVFVLLLMGRYHARMYTAYCTWYALGTLASMQVPFVGVLPIKGSEHMGALGVFGLLQLVAFAHYLRAQVSAEQFKVAVIGTVAGVVVLAALALVGLTYAGIVLPWTGRFYSLWDTDYAKIHIPIIASVSEHQPTAWPHFFFDTSFLIWLFPVGVYACMQELRDEHVFVIVYSVLASYFAGVMVRLMLTLTPIIAVCGAIAFSSVLDVYNTVGPADPVPETEEKNYTFFQRLTLRRVGSMIGRAVVIVSFAVYLFMFVKHADFVTETSYSSPSVVMASYMPDGSMFLIDDFREAYYWLRMNTPEDAKVMSWWDYGYQIGGMADRTTLVDNNTWNNTHIAAVGKAMSVDEDHAYPVLLEHDVDYILVVFGGALGFSGDDLNKFLWMVRISEGVWPEEVSEINYFNNGYYHLGPLASKTMRESMMYKMSYWRYQGQDRVRGVPITQNEVPSLDIVDEAFTSQNWLVRIYKVNKPDEFGRNPHQAKAFEAKA